MKPEKKNKKKAAPEDKALALPRKVLKRILRKNGNQFISATIIRPLDNLARKIVRDIVQDTLRLAVLEGRMTIRQQDVKRVLEMRKIAVY